VHEGAENASPQVAALTAGTPSGRAIGRLALLLRSGDKRDAEILTLRHQILVLQRQIDPRGSPRLTGRSSPGCRVPLSGRGSDGRC
jgi:hypothetical protein